MSARQSREPTRRQTSYLAFIEHYSEVNQRPPSEADIARYFGVSAPAVHQMILTLQARGFISRRPGAARSVQLLVASTPSKPQDRMRARQPRPVAMDSESPPAAEAVISVARDVLRRQFAHLDRFPIDDAEFAPLVRCLLDGIQFGLHAAGVPKRIATQARDRVLKEAISIYIADCARNDPSGADAHEDVKRFLNLMRHGERPRG